MVTFSFLHAVRSLGPEDCIDNVTISVSDVIINVPPGIVCIECSVGDEVAADATFQIDNTNINGRIGRVVDGVLVVFDTESVFNTFSTTDVQCMRVGLTVSHQVVMYLKSKLFTIQNHSSM